MMLAPRLRYIWPVRFTLYVLVLVPNSEDGAQFPTTALHTNLQRLFRYAKALDRSGRTYGMSRFGLFIRSSRYRGNPLVCSARFRHVVRK